jgi:flagellar export protein FliJ
MANYRLQTVLDLRAAAEKAASDSLEERRRELVALENELYKTQKLLAENQRLRQRQNAAIQTELAKGAARAQKIIAFQNYLADLREGENRLLAEAAQIADKINKTRAAVEQAAETLAAAVKETKVLKLHRAEWKNAESLNESRREQKNNDEIAAHRSKNTGR